MGCTGYKTFNGYAWSGSVGYASSVVYIYGVGSIYTGSIYGVGCIYMGWGVEWCIAVCFFPIPAAATKWSGIATRGIATLQQSGFPNPDPNPT